MKKYSFTVPDDWNLNSCFISIKGDTVRIDHPVDVHIYEVCETKLVLENNVVLENNNN